MYLAERALGLEPSSTKRESVLDGERSERARRAEYRPKAMRVYPDRAQCTNCLLNYGASGTKMRRRTTQTTGEVAERLNAPVLKTGKGL